MTNGTITYSLPDLKILPLNSFDVAPKFKPELTVLENSSGKTQRYLNTYRICYLDRRSLDPSIRSNSERKKVNIGSFCVKRAFLIRKIIKGLLEGHRGIPDFRWIEAAFDWIDQQGRSAELHSLEGTRRLYREYTDHIRHRLRLSNVGATIKSIDYPMARALQTALMYVCSLACNHDTKVVQSWAIRIPCKHIGLNELPAPATTTDEHALSCALHHRFFEAFSQAILENAAPPVIVKLMDLGFEDLIFYSKTANNANGWSTKGKEGRTDWRPFFYQREGVFEGKPKKFNKLLSEHDIPPISSKGFKRMQNNNRHFPQSALRELANYATRHFGYLLLAETGGNASHLGSINCQKMRLDKVVGLATTRAIKGRAGYEQQEQHVDIRFAQTTWKQYLKLRDWMCRQLEAPPESGLFLLLDREDQEPYTLLSNISLPQLRLWPKSAPTLSTRAARKHKTVNLLDGSGGNTALVAGMQFVSAQTIERHYAFKNREEAAKLMSEYFAAQAKSAEIRHSGVKPVRIMEGGETTHTGVCDSVEEGPTLIEGLDIQPRCSAPITCIFCTHFCLHAGSEEILRLLTIKLWIEIQSRHSSINIDEHFQKFLPYINRLQQILDDLSSMGGRISQDAKDAFVRFERGERDIFWGTKINALLDTVET